ncbi:MAG: hypothetical protein GF307_06185 [candidate division Zixibacteria bacterium]|nr:hypothetical protein [candidate division Zixibacteria bacterium]
MNKFKRINYKFGFLVLPFLLLAFMIMTSDGLGRTMPKKKEFRLNKPMVGTPNVTNATHRISNIWFTITNWGFLGSAQSTDIIDCETGEVAPSCWFPAGSDLEYLFQGAIWVGAIVEGDTLVSCGTDGWWDTHEYFPDESGDSTGEIWLGSVRPSTAYPRVTDNNCYEYQIPESLSISEEDFIAYYTDTNTVVAEVDPIDARPLRPLGLQVEQKSYSWSYEYAEDFILFDFKLTNIGENALSDMWMAFHIDADVHHTSVGSPGAQDDITGFLEKSQPIEGVDSLDINTAYIMDNDGDPGDGDVWDNRSVRGLTGTRVVRLPEGVDSLGFNWWISNVNSQLDWGPQWLSNYIGRFPGGGLGTPGGDATRYYILSNFEFDYDQVFAAIDWTAEDDPPGGKTWLAPLGEDLATDLANGYDTRYTYSFGPFPTIDPGDSVLLTVAYVAGADLHVNPLDYSETLENNETNRTAIESFIGRLDFSDFALNATWADWVYDNPGVDTDGDGNFGDCGQWEFDGTGDSTCALWVKGDGVPDFSGPPPPPSPRPLNFSTEVNSVTLSWNSTVSEYTEDTFGNGFDFEGYNVYRSRSQRLDEFTLLGSYDRIDYDSFYYDPLRGRMVLGKSRPLTLKELKERYGSKVTSGQIGQNVPFIVENKPPYEPLHCPMDHGFKVYRPHGNNTGLYEDYTIVNKILDGVIGPDGEVIEADTTWLTFDFKNDANHIFDSTVVNGDTLSDGTAVDKHYYSYKITGSLSSIPYYYSVTSLDYGDPRTKLAPLESSKGINMTSIYAINDFEKVEANQVYVYPNPYIDDGRYRTEGWEDINQDPQYSKRIYFANLPPGDVTIRIFTLDGDLVDRINVTSNPVDDNSQTENQLVEVDQPIVSWDLISRNTQSIVSGIYLFSVESDFGRQIGKFVVIK